MRVDERIASIHHDVKLLGRRLAQDDIAHPSDAQRWDESQSARQSPLIKPGEQTAAQAIICGDIDVPSRSLNSSNHHANAIEPRRTVTAMHAEWNANQGQRCIGQSLRI